MSQRLLLSTNLLVALGLLFGSIGCSNSSTKTVRADGLIARVEKLGGVASRSPGDPKSPITAIDLSEKKVTDHDLQELVHDKAIGSVTTIDLSKTQITGAGVGHLKVLGQLENLDLGNTKINDPDLESLGNLPNLKVLGLNSTQVTDAGLEHLKGLAKLETLDLSDTAVGDDGLSALEALKGLKTLELGETKTTDKGVEALKKALPDCTIDR
jgi:Leucine-rich repeat (LRR) protein